MKSKFNTPSRNQIRKSKYKTFFRKGFYIGNLNEIASENQIKEFFDAAQVMASNKEKYFHVWLTVSGKFDHGRNHAQVPIKDLKNVLADAKKNNLDLTQIWHQSFQHDDFKNVFGNMEGLVKKLTKKIYSNIKIDQIGTHTSLSLYEDGNFICPHNDGRNVDRLCIVLIYMSDPKKYIDGGGKLIIMDDKDKITNIEPLLGKYVVLEFTKNNVKHEVEMVKNGFQRLCYISIVGKVTPNNSNSIKY